jgi:hypothetical protein
MRIIPYYSILRAVRRVITTDGLKMLFESWPAKLLHRAGQQIIRLTKSGRLSRQNFRSAHYNIIVIMLRGKYNDFEISHPRVHCIERQPITARTFRYYTYYFGRKCMIIIVVHWKTAVTLMSTIINIARKNWHESLEYIIRVLDIPRNRVPSFLLICFSMYAPQRHVI